MNLNTSPFPSRGNNLEDLEKPSREFPTLDDLMSEQDIESKTVKTVHRRRDLDSLG